MSQISGTNAVSLLEQGAGLNNLLIDLQCTCVVWCIYRYRYIILYFRVEFDLRVRVKRKYNEIA